MKTIKSILALVAFMLLPVSSFSQQITIHVEYPGALGAMIDKYLKENYHDFRIIGKLNASDASALVSSKGIRSLDLSDATFPPREGMGTFFAGGSFQSIVLPTSLVALPNRALAGCRSLKSVTFPASLTSIEDSAFFRCASLESVTLPASLTSIGRYVFKECSSLKSVTFPASLTSIGTRAFSGCSSLKSVTFPASLTSIGTRAFSGCSSLKSVTLPASLDSIGYGAFLKCDYLVSVTSLSLNPPRITVPFDISSYNPIVVYIPVGSYSAYVREGWDKYKLVEIDLTDIKNPIQTDGDECVERYSIDGRRLSGVRRGVNVLRHRDGRVTKVWVK